MSHFYGTLQGNRGGETRCGYNSSGIVVQAAGWQGAISVDVYQNQDKLDCYTVHLVPWQGSGGHARLLASGILDANFVSHE